MGNQKAEIAEGDPQPLDPRNANAYMKHVRRQFPSLFPTDLHVVLRILEGGSWDYEWVDGFLIDKSPSSEPYDITEAGWPSLELAFSSLPPEFWRPPDSNSPLFKIPDDIQDCWFEVLNREAGRVIKWFEIGGGTPIADWIRATVRLRSPNDISDESYLAFLRSVKAFKVIKERLHFIQRRKYETQYPQPLVVKVGSVVRLKTGVETSTVKEIDHLIGGKCGPVARIDPPLSEAPGESPPRQWCCVVALEVVEDPKEKPDVPA